MAAAMEIILRIKVAIKVIVCQRNRQVDVQKPVESGVGKHPTHVIRRGEVRWYLRPLWSHPHSLPTSYLSILVSATVPPEGNFTDVCSNG